VIDKEPIIAVGLAENLESVSVRLDGDFIDTKGRPVPPGVVSLGSEEITLTPVNADRDRFSIEATIGIDFHWQQNETQTFLGRLRLVSQPGNRVTVINDVPLETYIASVVCSEMRSTSPPDLVKAHAIISRSWLLAQLEPQPPRPTERIRKDEVIRWYDRQAHAGFNVCADDHCQRYQGIGRIDSAEVADAVGDTRGMVLTHGGKPCDARFSKCCGGVTEDFKTAWGDEAVEYLVPIFDGPGLEMPVPPLTEERGLREFLKNPPEVYCRCTDERILKQVLNPYDLETQDFFRWRQELRARQASDLVRKKLGVDLGRIVSMQPVERGLSGRLKRLRLVGEAGSLVIGLELEIRRALSESHLYSSAFVVDTKGPDDRPDAFVLSGAGWGHGVGLCQIGAAAMAFQGVGYLEILEHYYPGTVLKRFWK
jgi:peptidoglycan hydrolase-like amidase